MKNKIFTLFFAMSTGVWALSAQEPGTIDTTFGTDGILLTDHVANTDEIITDMVVLPDDRIIVIGYAAGTNDDVLVAMYDTNGEPFTDFGNQGVSQLDLSIGGNDRAYAIFRLSNGKLLIGGSTYSPTGTTGFITRLNMDGSIDDTFGEGGTGTTLLNAGTETEAVVTDIIVQADNSILVLAAADNGTSNADIAIFKLSESGVINASFASNGVSLFDLGGGNGMDIPESIDLLPDGRMIVGGHSNTDIRVGFVVMFNSFGIIDNGFNGTGFYTYNTLVSDQRVMSVSASSGRILAAGYAAGGTNSDGFLLCLNTNGTLDEDFGSDGVVISDIGSGNGVYLHNLLLLANDQILLTGHTSGQSINGPYALVLNDDGTADSEFAPGGSVYPDLGIPLADINGRIAGVQSNGKILMGGHLASPGLDNENMYLFRLFGPDSGTSVAETNSFDTVSVFPNPASDQFSLQLEHGEKVNSVALYSLSGSLVTSWTFGQAQYLLPGDLSTGLYLLRVQTDSRMFDTRIMIAR